MRNFHHTVNVLVKAYLADELHHQNCAACAVGNIIADSINAKPTTARENGFACDMKLWIRNGELIEPLWPDLFCTDGAGQQEKDPKKYIGVRRKQIDVTGYTWQELSRIEKTFERTGANYDYDEDEKMYQSLLAVVDVLADIHNIDLTQKEEAKKLFVKVQN